MSEVLSDEQKAVVMHSNQPLLVLAGPGTGKTRCLTNRIAFLIKKKGISPKKILAITFTNTASEEMLDRLKKMGLSKAPQVTTLHSFAKNVLHTNASKLKIDSDFIVPDPKYEVSLIVEDVAIDLGLQISEANKIYKFICSKMASGISSVLKPNEKIFYGRFLKLLKFYKAVDFNNIIFLTYSLLSKNPDVKKHYNNYLSYVLVDEYQDLNPVEQWLIDLLTNDGQGLAVFGDDDQSIFGWRQADPKGIVLFDKKFPSVKVRELTESWRCPDVILRAAREVIRNNTTRKTKELKSKKKGGQVILYEAGGPKNEAVWITERVGELIKKGVKEIVILCFNKDLLIPIEKEFKGKNLEFVTSFKKDYPLASPSVRKILSLLRIRKDKTDNLAIRQLLELTHGVGKKCIKFLRDKAENDNITLFESFKLAILDKKAKRWKKGLEKLMQEISTTNNLSLSSNNPALLIQELKAYIKKDKRIDKLLFSINLKQVNTLEDFLEEIEKLIFDQLRESKVTVSSDKVTIMTMHSAKGLEANAVFLPGLEADVFPGSGDIEEKRRLFYVALTRAKELIYLSYAKMRKDSVSRGYRPYSEGYPSQFIKEIPEKLLTITN